MVHYTPMREFPSKSILKLPETSGVMWGHWLYCRKCITEEGVIALPEKTKAQCDWERVEAIGKDVGRPRFGDEAGLSDTQAGRLEMHNIPRCILGEIKRGDILLVPDEMPLSLIGHSPYDDKEFFLDESVMLCKWLGEDDYLPLGNRILVEPDAFDKESDGIELPDQAEGLPSQATVVKLGTGICDYSNNPVPFDVVIGDRVLLPSEQFKEIQCGNGKRYQIVDADKIVAVL